MAAEDTDTAAYQQKHWNDDVGSGYIVASAVLFALAAFSVAIRLSVHKFSSNRGLGWDDLLLLLALVVSAGLCAVVILAASVGLGKHQWRVNAEDRHPPRYNRISLQCGYTVTILQPIASGLIKISLCIYYRRIFTTLRKAFTWGLYANVAFCLAWAVSTLIVMIVQCVPVPYFWYRAYSLSGIKPPYKMTGTCEPQIPHNVATAAVNVVSDFGILLLPLIGLRGLQMSTRRKVGIAAIFALGFFVCIVDCIRTYYFAAIENVGDSSWTNAPGFIWAAVEVTVGIICASIPTYAHAIRQVMNRYKESSNKYHRSGQTGHWSDTSRSSGWKSLLRRPTATHQLNSHTGSTRHLALNTDIELNDVRRSEGLPHESHDNNGVETRATVSAGSRHKATKPDPKDAIRMQRDVWVDEDTIV